MNTLIIGNQPVAQRRADIVRAWKTGKPEAAARLDFESLEGAWQLLNTKRWGICGRGPGKVRSPFARSRAASVATCGRSVATCGRFICPA